MNLELTTNVFTNSREFCGFGVIPDLKDDHHLQLLPYPNYPNNPVYSVIVIKTNIYSISIEKYYN